MDLDFGELYHILAGDKLPGVIVLRLRDQRVENVNSVLNRFFSDKQSAKLIKQKFNRLIILTNHRSESASPFDKTNTRRQRRVF